MIEVKDVTMSHDEDGNQIIITQTVTKVLEDDEAIKYINLDTLLRRLPTEAVGDLMCDFQWSFVDDVLTTIDWSTLDEFLTAVEELQEEIMG